jgi:hypothetical protein
MPVKINPDQFNNFPLGPDWFVFWDDFNDEYALTSNEPVAASSPWVGTALSSGTTAFSTDEKFGVMVLSGAATTDNSGSQVQGDMETISFNAGKKVRFLARLKLSDGTEDEVYAGLGISDTTFLDGTGTLAGGLTHTDSVGFYKPDGSTDIFFVVRRDSINSTIGPFSSRIVAATYAVLAFEVEMDPTVAGRGVARAYIDGVSLGSLNSDTFPYDTEEILTPTLAFVSGNATGTKTCTVDYAGAAQER